MNHAGTPCPIPRLLPLKLVGPEPDHTGPVPPCHQHDKTLKKKYVDDLTLLEAINLRLALTKSVPTIGPRNFHEQSGLILPPDKSILQHQLADLLRFTEEHHMKINRKKTKILVFNPSKKLDFLPQLNFPGESPLEVIYSTKLLGVTLSSNLSWQEHVDSTT